MNCTVLQRRLLELEQPDRPPPEVRAHLAACAVCRRWQRRLVQIEQRVPLIPVPPSGAKSAVIRRVLAEPAAAAKGPSRAEPPKFRPFAPGIEPRSRRQLQIAGITTLAACLALFAFGLWGANQGQRVPPTSSFSNNLPSRLAQHQRNLDAATKPSEKMKVLGDFAEELHTDTRTLAAGKSSVNDLKTLSRVYKGVVGEGFYRQAQEVSPGERDQVLGPIISELEKTAADALDLAKTTSPEAATHLRDIARAANDARGQLRTLTATASS
jgi:hypothetical protein